MSKALNIGFQINAPVPIDSRMQVSTYDGLASIPIKYEGLKTFVKDENKEYRYYSTGWAVWSGNDSGGGSWGSIEGTLSDQTDLANALGLKYDKTGGIISGLVTVTANVEAKNFILYASGATTTREPIKGIRVTMTDYEIDWSLGDTFMGLDLTQAETITDLNLPQDTDTLTISFYLTGDFVPTVPAYWVLVAGEYDGTKVNQFVIECVDGTAASEIVYYSINTLP